MFRFLIVCDILLCAHTCCSGHAGVSGSTSPMVRAHRHHFPGPSLQFIGHMFSGTSLMSLSLSFLSFKMGCTILLLCVPQNQKEIVMLQVMQILQGSLHYFFLYDSFCILPLLYSKNAFNSTHWLWVCIPCYWDQEEEEEEKNIYMWKSHEPCR